MKNVALITDQKQAVEALQTCLKHSRAFRVGSCFASAQTAITELPGNPPDLVLMAVQLPGRGGIETTRALKNVLPKLPIVLFAQTAEISTLFAAFQAGAQGLMTLPISSESLQSILQEVAAGMKTISPQMQTLLLEHITGLNAPQLTSEERKVMDHLLTKKCDKEISALTGKAIGTVHCMTANIFRKLGVHNRREAAATYLGIQTEGPPAG